MAEMTAAQAVYKITEKIFIDPEVRQQIAALIEQQAAEIAKYQRRDVSIINQVCNEVDRSRNADMEIMMLRTRVNKQQQDIAKKDRMIENACDRLSKLRKCPPEVCDLPYHPGDVECCKHWLAWLEKEAQGVAR